jgi:hypothetical protein
MILEGTTESGAIVPVQVTAAGKVVAEGLQGPQGPQGPEGPPGPPGPGGGLFASFAVVRDQRSSGTHGGGYSANNWTKRVLNTIVSDPDGIVSLSNNELVLAAGSYLIEWSCPMVDTGKQQSRLRNTTENTDLDYGSSQFFGTQLNTTSRSGSTTAVTLTGAQHLELQSRGDVSRADFGLGYGGGQGAYEVYSQVLIYKLS